MRIARSVVAASFAALVLGGCASRCCHPCGPCDGAAAGGAPPPGPPAYAVRAQTLLDAAMAREPYLPMKSEEESRAALKSMKKYPRVPNLIRIAAVAPKTVDAEMKAWETLEKETTLDERLVSEVFYVVSSTNECGH